MGTSETDLGTAYSTPLLAVRARKPLTSSRWPRQALVQRNVAMMPATAQNECASDPLGLDGPPHLSHGRIQVPVEEQVHPGQHEVGPGEAKAVVPATEIAPPPSTCTDAGVGSGHPASGPDRSRRTGQTGDPGRPRRAGDTRRAQVINLLRFARDRALAAHRAANAL